MTIQIVFRKAALCIIKTDLTENKSEVISDKLIMHLNMKCSGVTGVTACNRREDSAAG